LFIQAQSDFKERQAINAILAHVFQKELIGVERVPEGVSTRVYRVLFPHETFYLRILPEEQASFAPEIFVLSQLRQKQVKVPEVLYFEHRHEILQRSIMLTTEVKGQSISQSRFLTRTELEQITEEAGRDLAIINALPVEGFGWVKREQAEVISLRAECPDQRGFALEFWEADLAYLAQHVLSATERTRLAAILVQYDEGLDDTQAYLAHGDFDTTHIFQDQGQYTGIIDFGEIRGANRYYDLAHFHVRDGEALPLPLLPALIRGYKQITHLPTEADQHMRFMSLLINVRTLARALQKRPSDHYTQHQLVVLREDLAVF
jgi:aminoglycoside phosphotransferase (APT) family kinase protein